MEDQFITAIEQTIRDRYQQKYGRVTIDLDEVVPEEDNQARIQFTIRKADSFITRYYGWASYQDGQVIPTRELFLRCLLFQVTGEQNGIAIGVFDEGETHPNGGYWIGGMIALIAVSDQLCIFGLNRRLALQVIFIDGSIAARCLWLLIVDKCRVPAIWVGV